MAAEAKAAKFVVAPPTAQARIFSVALRVLACFSV
jgi:hypothetical protein